MQEGFTIPVSTSLSDVDLDEILSELDARTRDYVTLLANGAGEGLKDRGHGPGGRLQALRADACATSRASTTRWPPSAIALRRLVTSLAQVNSTLARKPRRPDAARAQSARRRCARSPPRTPTCATPPASWRRRCSRRRRRCATCSRSPSSSGRRRARCCRPCGSWKASTRAVTPFAREATPIVREKIRPFVRGPSRWSRDLAPAARGLPRTFPELRRNLKSSTTCSTCSATTRTAARRPTSAGRDEGYLFWLAWVTHQTANLQNIDDANGPMRPIFLTGTCRRSRASSTTCRRSSSCSACRRCWRPSATTRRRPRSTRARSRCAQIGVKAKGGREVNTSAPTPGRILVDRGLLAVVLRAAAVPLAGVRRPDPAQAEGLPRAGRLHRGRRRWPTRPTSAWPA